MNSNQNAHRKTLAETNSSHPKIDDESILSCWFPTYLQVRTASFKESTPPKTNMTMEKLPFEDASPIRNGDFPLSC